MKAKVGKAIAERVKDGEVLGVGTGSTVDAALTALKERIEKESLQVSVVTSSLQSAWRCQEIGLTVLHSGFSGKIDWGFDGADAVDTSLRAIKGKGGALLQEKILAVRCGFFVLIVDESKLVENIAEKSFVPVEVLPEAMHYVKKELAARGAYRVELREAQLKHGPVITEAGNVLLDAYFHEIVGGLEQAISSIVGVVESGLFLSQSCEALVAGVDEVYSIIRE